MKIIKEDIANLERCIENDKVNTVGSMPIAMADAFYQSQKNDGRLEDVMKETDDVPELEKVIGAEKQPVPKKPEEFKVTLEENLFEDYDPDIRHYSDMLFNMIEDDMVNTKSIAQSLIYWCSEDNIEKFMRVNDLIWDENEEEEVDEYEESLKESVSKDIYYALKNKEKDIYYVAKNKETGDIERIDNDINALEDFIANQEWLASLRGKHDRYDIEVFKGKDVNASELWPNLNYVKKQPGVYTFDTAREADDAYRNMFVRGFEARKDGKDVIIFGNKEKSLFKESNKEDWDLFITIQQELYWENPNFKRRTKFPEISAKQRYESEDIGIEYKVDGFIDIIIRQDSKKDFDFAKKVADVYNVKTIGPKPDGFNQFKFTLRVPEP